MYTSKGSGRSVILPENSDVQMKKACLTRRAEMDVLQAVGVMR